MLEEVADVLVAVFVLELVSEVLLLEESVELLVDVLEMVTEVLVLEDPTTVLVVVVLVPPVQIPPVQTPPLPQGVPSPRVVWLQVAVPGAQVSVVHGLWSSHFARWTQPAVSEQASIVHGSLSLQLGGGPPTHTPLLQWSLVVHALPSLHAAVLLVCTQPTPGLQLSSVHGLWSSQPVTFAHCPVVTSQLSAVHGSASPQSASLVHAARKGDALAIVRSRAPPPTPCTCVATLLKLMPWARLATPLYIHTP